MPAGGSLLGTGLNGDIDMACLWGEGGGYVT